MGTFSKEAILLAQESEEKYGVPASVTLAQYALESGYGKSYLARTKNNYFGMRNGSKGWQSFDSMADSFDAHGKLLSTSLYADKVKNAASVEDYVNGIAETYAPSSDGNNNYAGTLLQIIRENNLTQYDKGSYSGSGQTVTETTTTTKAGKIEEIGNSIIGGFINGVVIIGVGVLAVVFFMTAFDVKIPSVKGVVHK